MYRRRLQGQFLLMGPRHLLFFSFLLVALFMFLIPLQVGRDDVPQRASTRHPCPTDVGVVMRRAGVVTRSCALFVKAPQRIFEALGDLLKLGLRGPRACVPGAVVLDPGGTGKHLFMIEEVHGEELYVLGIGRVKDEEILHILLSVDGAGFVGTVTNVVASGIIGSGGCVGTVVVGGVVRRAGRGTQGLYARVGPGSGVGRGRT